MNLIMPGPVRRCRGGGSSGGNNTLVPTLNRCCEALQCSVQPGYAKETHTQSWSLALTQSTTRVGGFFAETPSRIYIVGNVKHPTVFSGLANEKQCVSCMKDTSV